MDVSVQGHFSLESTAKDGRPQFRAYAEQMLDYLKHTGLPELEKLRQAPVGQPLAGARDDHPEPHDLGVSKITLDNEQVVYLLFHAERSEHGNREIAALSRKGAQEWLAGSHAETAIIAAVTVMDQNEPIDVPKLRKALSLIKEPFTTSAEKLRRDTARKMLDAVDEKYNYGIDDLEKWKEEREPAIRFQDNLQTPSLEYVLTLLRYMRPGFDDYPQDMQAELILRTCERINDLLEAAEKLAAFLEYGTERGLPKKTVDNVSKDVAAAVLRDVVGQTYREIGEELRVELPPNFEIKGEHDTVRHKVERGRNYLQRALGEEGWRSRAKAMRTDMERHNALSKEEQTLERWVERWGVPREAQERYRQEIDQTAERLSSLLGISKQEILERLQRPGEEMG